MNPTNPNERSGLRPSQPPLRTQPQAMPPRPDITPSAMKQAAPRPTMQQTLRTQPTMEPVATAQPVRPAMQPQPSTSEVPRNPQDKTTPTASSAKVAPSKPKKSRKKFITLLMVTIAALALLGIGAWALMTFVFHGLKLETYNGDGYSVLKPVDYEQDETSTTISWTSPKQDIDGRSVYSRLQVATMDMTAGRKPADLVATYDDFFTEDAFKAYIDASTAFGGETELKNYVVNKDDYRGLAARAYTAEVYQKDVRIGNVYMRYVFDDNKMYMVLVADHTHDKEGFAGSAKKIFNSLTVNE